MMDLMVLQSVVEVEHRSRKSLLRRIVYAIYVTTTSCQHATLLIHAPRSFPVALSQIPLGSMPPGDRSPLFKKRRLCGSSKSNAFYRVGWDAMRIRVKKMEENIQWD